MTARCRPVGCGGKVGQTQLGLAAVSYTHLLWFVSLVRSSVVSWLAVVTLRMIALITVVAALVV